MMLMEEESPLVKQVYSRKGLRNSMCTPDCVLQNESTEINRRILGAVAFIYSTTSFSHISQ